jgi:hypothetical protein
MRFCLWGIVIAFATGCAVDDELDSSTAAATVNRSPLEANCDDLLLANDGRGCDVENGRQVCIITTAVSPPRVLRVGDAIPSGSTLELCTGGACSFVTPQPAPEKFHCAGLSGCLPLAVGCGDSGASMHCEPHPSPFPGGGTDYYCSCSKLD